MAQLDRSIATLRIAGDDLQPAEISALLGHAASKQQVKGEVFVGKVSGRSRTAKTGMWRLEATDAAPENLDGSPNRSNHQPVLKPNSLHESRGGSQLKFLNILQNLKLSKWTYLMKSV